MTRGKVQFAFIYSVTNTPRILADLLISYQREFRENFGQYWLFGKKKPVFQLYFC